MQLLSNQYRSNSNSTSGCQIGTSQNVAQIKQLIKQANSASLLSIMKHYGLKIDALNRKAICPFPSHKGGKETTPSLWYYPESDTFWCFGCKAGTHAVDFVVSFEGIGRLQAARKIINLISKGLPERESEEINFIIDYSERLRLIMDLSNSIREAFRANILDFDYVEDIAQTFDKMNLKYELNNDAIKSLIIKLKAKLK